MHGFGPELTLYNITHSQTLVLSSKPLAVWVLVGQGNASEKSMYAMYRMYPYTGVVSFYKMLCESFSNQTCKLKQKP